jgi:hypothetical protein
MPSEIVSLHSEDYALPIHRHGIKGLKAQKWAKASARNRVDTVPPFPSFHHSHGSSVKVPTEGPQWTCLRFLLRSGE